MNFFRENIATLDPQFSRISEQQKQHYINKNLKGERAIKNTNFVIAEKLRKDYFPISGLESLLIANAISITKNKN